MARRSKKFIEDDFDISDSSDVEKDNMDILDEYDELFQDIIDELYKFGIDRGLLSRIEKDSVVLRNISKEYMFSDYLKYCNLLGDALNIIKWCDRKKVRANRKLLLEKFISYPTICFLFSNIISMGYFSEKEEKKVFSSLLKYFLSSGGPNLEDVYSIIKESRFSSNEV